LDTFEAAEQGAFDARRAQELFTLNAIPFGDTSIACASA